MPDNTNDAKPSPWQWYRYRHGTNATDGSWEYTERGYGLSTPDILNDIATSLMDECIYANEPGYRGVEVEAIDHPPADYLRKTIVAHQNSIERRLNTVKRWTAQLRELST